MILWGKIFIHKEELKLYEGNRNMKRQLNVYEIESQSHSSYGSPGNHWVCCWAIQVLQRWSVPKRVSTSYNLLLSFVQWLMLSFREMKLIYLSYAYSNWITFKASRHNFILKEREILLRKLDARKTKIDLLMSSFFSRENNFESENSHERRYLELEYGWSKI